MSLGLHLHEREHIFWCLLQIGVQIPPGNVFTGNPLQTCAQECDDGEESFFQRRQV